MGRVHDYQNYDFIKHKAKYPEVMPILYKQFGILNLFSPFRPNGTYLLDLGIYEERVVTKMLCELAVKEGIGNMSDLKLQGKPMEKLTGEFMRKMPEVGQFECQYFCEADKENKEFRLAIGAKYLDWPAI